MGDELYAITHLRYLGEHRGSATRNEEIGSITGRRIRCDTGERIRTTALHADEQVGQWQFLSLPLIQNLQLLFRHRADGIHHGLIALIVLKDDNIVLVVQLRPPLTEAVDGELLTAETHQHEDTTEIRMGCDVTDDLLRNVGIRCIDGDTAAVWMIDRNDIVYVRILRQDLPLDALDGNIEHTRDTLHGRVDTEDVSRAGVTTVRITIAHPGCSLRLREIGTDVRRKLHLIEIRCRCHDEVLLIDPATDRDILCGRAEYHAIAQNLRALRKCLQRDLMRLRDVFDGNDARHHFRALRHIMDGNGDIITLSDLNA